MSPNEKRTELGGITPFFIVSDVPRAMNFYVESLGFEVQFVEPPEEPFFGIVGRDGAQIFFKHVSDEVRATPNVKRHPDALWDAFVYVHEPDKLHSEFAARGVKFHKGIVDREDGLRGFEIEDAEGYVLFFGRPR